MPVLVAWLGTPLGCCAGSTSTSAGVTTASVIAGRLLLASRARRGADGGGLARPVAVAVARSLAGAAVAVAVAVTVDGVCVVRLRVVGRLVAPAEGRQDQQHA